MNTQLKYSHSLHVYLKGRNPSLKPDVIGWLGSLSDAELTEFGQMVRLATRGKAIEDVARFIAAAMPANDAVAPPPTKKILERFLISTYSTIVLERKERLHARGKLTPRQNHNHACSCCSQD
jgi:hypothetical protein